MAPTQITGQEVLRAKERDRKIEEANSIIKSIVDSLCFRWSLELELPNQKESPRSRICSMTTEQECIAMIKGICFKDTGKMFEIKKAFEEEANDFYGKSVRKPQAERGVVPEKTRHRTHPLTPAERKFLLDRLHKLLTPVWDSVKRAMTPKRSVPEDAQLDDSPLPFPLKKSSDGSNAEVLYPTLRKSSAESKRAREEPFQDISPMKKTKSDVLGPQSTNSILPPDTLLGRGRSSMRESGNTRSADTSFASDASSFWSRAGPSSFPASTQETVPDEEPDLPGPESRKSFMVPQPEKNQSSDFASSSFEARVAGVSEEDVIVLSSPATASEDQTVTEELSQDLKEYTIDDDESLLEPAERQLKIGLKSVFPPFAQPLEGAPLCIAYEITRVFLHAEVPLSDFNAPVSSRLEDYDTLWALLKALPVLEGRPFPERCNAEVWKSALNGYQKGFQSVILAGSLLFNSSASLHPLFKLQLAPMKFDESHRLGRRFGHDRFLELSMPNITDNKAPEAVKGLVKRLGQEKWCEMICEWLIDSLHPLLARHWQPFFLKPKDRKSRRRVKTDDAPDAAHRVFFFAVDGFDFIGNSRLAATNHSDGHPHMTIKELLNKIRPTEKNVHQSYLKLFSRTALAISRNSETIILEKDQILFRDDIRSEIGKREVMNDGAGRISISLALKVTHKLNLNYFPSGFQGRLGEAKGFWVVDHTCKTGEDWIEVYESQQKWKRSTEPNGESDDRSHRAFEVLNTAKPLKSADLNTQLLPLLMHGAKDPGHPKQTQEQTMRNAISNLLRQGLAQELADMQEAMNAPSTFIKWVRDNKSTTEERLRAGAVPYRGGLPVATEERLNVMLDAGFDPKKLTFMNELARFVFRNKCEDLKKRMNITVGKSAYAYMVPDFWGVLEPNEVHIDFSSFVDHNSGFSSAAVLNGDDILVARNPAHFVSDIQKVKAVIKPELMGLKDVIVFSTKGDVSLASKLSGGDYDGDMAWICWEPSIVDNFVPSEVPKVHHLVEEGLIIQDTMKYEDLVRRKAAKTSTFLKRAFKFNLQPSMLGICTLYKERLCYTQGRIDTEESEYLSQLLSYLVDQAKQGYIFDEDLWQNFKDQKIKIKIKQPAYEDPIPGGNCTKDSKHIMDYLKWVAYDSVEKSLVEFSKTFKSDTTWKDEVLSSRYNWAREHSKTNPDWKSLLDTLKEDIEALKTAWKKKMARHQKGEDSTFNTDVVEFYARFRNIRPRVDNTLTQVLLCDELHDSEFTPWELLKGSTLFASYRGPSSFPWYMGGRQLCHLKAHCGGFGAPHSVIPSMYILGKPDASVIRKLRGAGQCSVDDNASVINVDDLAEMADD